MRIHRLLAASLVAFMVSVLWSIAPQPAAAASDRPITIAITATVDEVYDPFQVLGGTIQPGGTITGRYIYNAAASNSSPTPNIGTYWHTTAPYGISLNAGGHVFETDPQNVRFSVYLQNNFQSGDISHDLYMVYSQNNRSLSYNIYVKGIYWSLEDLSQTALKSIALPKTAPTLSDWQQTGRDGTGLLVEGFAANAQYPQEPYPFIIRGYMTQAQKITR